MQERTYLLEIGIPCWYWFILGFLQLKIYKTANIILQQWEINKKRNWFLLILLAYQISSPLIKFLSILQQAILIKRIMQKISWFVSFAFCSKKTDIFL